MYLLTLEVAVGEKHQLGPDSVSQYMERFPLHHFRFNALYSEGAVQSVLEEVAVYPAEGAGPEREVVQHGVAERIVLQRSDVGSGHRQLHPRSVPHFSHRCLIAEHEGGQPVAHHIVEAQLEGFVEGGVELEGP